MSQNNEDDFAVSYGMPLVPTDLHMPRSKDQCKFNREVQCPEEEQHKCQKCGWNPIVDGIRKSKTREKMGLGW